ncbi:hypothetical protein [Ideonella sp. YS5]|uniref:hypothetical protein n=1 Tax=Ideonella sp. YS5 TaxID=3453714 RepID=UPI003EEF1610
MSEALHVHFSRHPSPVTPPQGVGELLAQQAQHEAVKALLGAILTQLMQAMMGNEGQAGGPQGAGGAGGGAGSGKAQGLLQEYAQLLSLLGQLAAGQDRPPSDQPRQGARIEDTKSDVLTPQAAQVEGAQHPRWKDHTG